MADIDVSRGGRKKPVTYSIREDVIAEAKLLHINASQAAEQGLVSAVKAAKQAQWSRDNKAFIEAHNARIEREGPVLTPGWLKVT